jgi:hypothetical protein
MLDEWRPALSRLWHSLHIAHYALLTHMDVLIVPTNAALLIET